MKSFDEWINKEGFNFRPEQYDLYKSLYEAGQQSKHDEVDLLQDRVDSLHKNIDALHVDNERIQKEYQMMFEGVQGRQKTIDELQKRIDEALKILDGMRHNGAYRAIDALKGDQS